MKLHEKIYFCRKEAGLSQDALAERLGVSRQAISKWENGEAVPETMKLPILAKQFGVTVDWLLSEEADDMEMPPKTTPEPDAEPIETASNEAKEEKTDTSMPSWIDGLPKSIGKIVRRFGWLAGVYVAIGGAGVTAIGAIAKIVSKTMMRGVSSVMNSMGGSMNPFGDASGGIMIYDEFGNPMDSATAELIMGELNLGADFGGFSAGMDGVTELMSFNPVDMVASFIIVIGVVMMVGGVILAVCLRKWGQSGDN